MDAFFFGDLFGIYDPPPNADAGAGVVLCPPIGQEYMRTHWAFVQLAQQLGRAGFHVLRFDYYGVGDSAGEAGTVARWREDVRAAVAELKRRSGLKRISVVGLRVGALLAATTDVRVQDLVLWDPVVSGAAYRKELEALQDALVQDRDRFASPRARNAADGLLGFPFPDDLAGVELREAPGAKRVFVVGPQVDLAQELGATHVEVGEPGGWDRVQEFENALLASRTITAIVEALGA